LVEKDDALKEHELSKIIREPGQPANATVLLGYVIKSGSQDTVRLAFNISFDEYADIPRKEILHSAKASEDVIEFGGTYIWIPKDLDVKVVKIESTKLPAQFLEGKIAQKYTKATEIATIGGVGGATLFRSCLVQCQPLTIIFRTCNFQWCQPTAIVRTCYWRWCWPPWTVYGPRCWPIPSPYCPPLSTACPDQGDPSGPIVNPGPVEVGAGG
jgi:hypothetical protein